MMVGWLRFNGNINTNEIISSEKFFHIGIRAILLTVMKLRSTFGQNVVDIKYFLTAATFWWLCMFNKIRMS